MAPTDDPRAPHPPDDDTGEDDHDEVEPEAEADPGSPGSGLVRGEEPAEPNEPG